MMCWEANINNKSLYDSVCEYDFALHFLVELGWNWYEGGMEHVEFSVMSFLLIVILI